VRLDRFDHLVRTVRSIAATRPTSGSEISTDLRRTHFLLSPAPA